MPSPTDEIIEFQIHVARTWIDEARSVNGRPPFEFVAYFSALNALYWLWGMLDDREAFTQAERDSVELLLQGAPPDLRGKVMGRIGGLRNEASLIQALVERLDGEVAAAIVAKHADYVRFLVDERRRPIHRMDARSTTNAGGDRQEGAKYLRWLAAAESDPPKKLRALAGTLYLVRCNLVHGSKVAYVEDGGLVGQSVPPLRSIAEATLEYTVRCHRA